MRRRLLLLLLASMSFLMVAEAKPKNQKVDLPAIFKNARYVYVEAYDGDALDRRLVSDDRQAIYNVEQGLKDWHRYSITLQRDRADLVFLVRKGRVASVSPRLEVGIGSQPQNRNSSPPDPTRSDKSIGAGVDAEAGSADDRLAIYLVDPTGELTGPIWSQSLKGGLDAPAVPLFQRIKHEVDAAYP